MFSNTAILQRSDRPCQSLVIHYKTNAAISLCFSFAIYWVTQPSVGAGKKQQQTMLLHIPSKLSLSDRHSLQLLKGSATGASFTQFYAVSSLKPEQKQPLGPQRRKKPLRALPEALSPGGRRRGRARASPGLGGEGRASARGSRRVWKRQEPQGAAGREGERSPREGGGGGVASGGERGPAACYLSGRVFPQAVPRRQVEAGAAAQREGSAQQQAAPAASCCCRCCRGSTVVSARGPQPPGRQQRGGPPGPAGNRHLPGTARRGRAGAQGRGGPFKPRPLRVPPHPPEMAAPAHR